MADAYRDIQVKVTVDASALFDVLDEIREGLALVRATQRRSLLAAHGIEGDDAKTSIATLERSIDEGAPSPTDPSLQLDALSDEQLATKFAKWYGHDAVRAAVILYRFGR